MSHEIRAIDPWVNVSMGDQVPAEFLKRVKEDYFRAGEDFFKSLTIEETLAHMDSCGVQKAILSVEAQRPDERVLEFPKAHPDRFALAAQVDPRRGMEALWALEKLVQQHAVVMARVTPFLLDLPPNDRVYYPLYTKCVELDLAVNINTGIPGPPMPGECQHPMHLDKVCLFFPQLKIVMAHGADPWWREAIRLMIKYKNLYLMTSAYAPKYLPPELLHYMNTRGKHKILYASDHPVLPMQRCVKEASQLDLREGVLDQYLYANAEKVFFSPRNPRY